MKRSPGNERDDVTGITVSIDDDRGGSGWVRWELILYRAGQSTPKLNIVKEGRARSLANAMVVASAKAVDLLFRKGD
jgi:hypothetical protein